MSFSIRLGMRTLMTAAALSALSSPLLAQGECAADADCEKGFTCEVTGGSACSGAAVAPCAPGTDCAVPPPPDCEPMEYKSCLPGPCTTDSDCASGMVCHTEVSKECPAAAACAPGTDCKQAPEDCALVETASCVPKWALPCEAAADCGAGFECVPQESCSCSGGAPTMLASPAMTTNAADVAPGMGAAPEAPAQDAGAAAPQALPAPPRGTEPASTVTPFECSCVPSGVSACRVIETECTTNSDCPAEWTCIAEPQATCGGSSGSGGTTMGGAGTPTAGKQAPAPVPEGDVPLDLVAPAPIDAGAGTLAPERPMNEPCAMVVARSVCQPPHRDVYGGISVDNGGMPESPVTGSGGGTPVATALPSPMVPTAPPADGETKPTPGGVTGKPPVDDKDTDVAPAPSVAETNTPVSHNAAVEEEEADGAGCAVAQGPARHASSSGLWLVAAGLGALFSRRRNARG